MHELVRDALCASSPFLMILGITILAPAIATLWLSLLHIAYTVL